MSVSKNWDTNLRHSERKTLRGFLGLYLFLCVAIFLLLGIGYYHTRKNSMLESKRAELNLLANLQIKRLKNLHVNIDKTKKYPRDKRFHSGIFDNSKVAIFSLLQTTPKLDQIIYKNQENIYYVKELENYYVGAKYLVLEIHDDNKWLEHTYLMLLRFGIPLVILFLVVGYFLHRLLLRPMREAISLLDRFIKDTTHELNTPISTILSNIEMINFENLEAKTQKKLKRIEIGARTVSNIYQDLVYLTLGHLEASKSENVDLKALFQERLEYFAILFENRHISVTTKLSQTSLFIDKQKLTKLIDNLLSNAIKYNRPHGSLHVKLEKNYFEIRDSGYGMEQQKIEAMFERYTRGDNSSVGGFGIGLNIVAMIAKKYHLQIDATSNKGEGTCIKIMWE